MLSAAFSVLYKCLPIIGLRVCGVCCEVYLFSLVCTSNICVYFFLFFSQHATINILERNTTMAFSTSSQQAVLCAVCICILGSDIC